MTINGWRQCAAALALALIAAGCQGNARPGTEETSSCVRCHGGFDASEPARTGLALAAPPRSTLGGTDTSDPRVGAHRQHLVDGSLRAAIECRECHVVPTQVDGHFGGTGTGRATVTFAGELGRAQLPAGVVPSYDPDAVPGPSCSNVYCHGATLSGGADTSPVWTTVNGAQRGCGSCHGYPPPWHNSTFGAAAGSCVTCHSGTLSSDYSINVAGGLHIDGTIQGPILGTGCAGCHSFPPSSAIHDIHSSPPSSEGVVYGDLHTGAGATAESYDFGCGECHPTNDVSHYVDVGASGPDVDLLPPAVPVPGDEIKRRNDPSAAYDPVTGTCSGVYCHSSGQETPAYVTTPDWRNPPAGGIGCDGCHGNPPSYPSGAAGTATANSHVYLDSLGWEAGHFAGVPGTGHGGSRHGGGEYAISGDGYYGANQVASPITCQACHYETVDPTDVLPGRFFYFDTSGTYRLTGANEDTARENSTEWQASQCGFCHDASPGSIAPPGVGKVLPARHVNGIRDVAFDRRTTYDGTPEGVPALPGGSTLRPYYVTTEYKMFEGNVHPDMEVLPSTGAPELLHFHLANAAYDSATKTCSNVACHVLREDAVNQNGMPPLVWGDHVPPPSGPPYPWQGCSSCHTNY